MSSDDKRTPEGKFALGRPGGPGRPPGTLKTKRAKAGEEMARAIVESRWTDLVTRFLDSEDDKVALSCFTFLFDHAYGRAKVRAEVDRTERKVSIQFDVGKAHSVSISDDRAAAFDAEIVGECDGDGASPCLPASSDVEGSDELP